MTVTYLKDRRINKIKEDGGYYKAGWYPFPEYKFWRCVTKKGRKIQFKIKDMEDNDLINVLNQLWVK